MFEISLNLVELIFARKILALKSFKISLLALHRLLRKDKQKNNISDWKMTKGALFFINNVFYFGLKVH